MEQPSPSPGAAPHVISLVSVDFDGAKGEFGVHASPWILAALVAAVLLAVVVRRNLWRRLREFQVAEAELTVGAGRVTLRPNDTDRQIAYQIWVELSTRKIGLPLDLTHDVVSEVYDSWYRFFETTRELIKTVPVSRVSDDSTSKIINLSIEVLNEGLRPHLARWQARFRSWLAYEAKASAASYVDPQALQRAFPEYDALAEDLLRVNKMLIAYRNDMRKLVDHGRG
jgi:hypothetical protein